MNECKESKNYAAYDFISSCTLHTRKYRDAEGDRQVLYTSAVHKNVFYGAAGDVQPFPTRERYRVLG